MMIRKKTISKLIISIPLCSFAILSGCKSKNDPPPYVMGENNIIKWYYDNPDKLDFKINQCGKSVWISDIIHSNCTEVRAAWAQKKQQEIEQ